MPQILLSTMKALPYDFEKAVAEYVVARREHSQTIGEGAPRARDQLVELFVKRVPPNEHNNEEDFVADFEIVDDMQAPPPPDPAVLTLDQKKAKLASEAQAAAIVIWDKILPPLKRRMVAADRGRIFKIAEQDRTPVDVAAMAKYEADQERGQAIELHLGLLESEIDDLTEETVDAWKPKEFPAV